VSKETQANAFRRRAVVGATAVVVDAPSTGGPQGFGWLSHRILGRGGGGHSTTRCVGTVGLLGERSLQVELLKSQLACQIDYTT